MIYLTAQNREERDLKNEPPLDSITGIQVSFFTPDWWFDVQNLA